MQNAPETAARSGVMSPAQARWHRARVSSTAHRLDQVWGNDPALPAIGWASLSTIPGWVLSEPPELKRLAFLTGALFAAPSLRVCLDAAPLLRMRKLLGSTALDLVLETPDLPANAVSWSIDARTKGAEIYVWSASLLLASVEDPLTRATLARSLGLSHDPSSPALVDVPTAVRMVNRAIEIAQTIDQAAVSTKG
jgi:hypothetical protein